MDVHTAQRDARLDEAQARWRTASDRLWPVAMSDGVAYREATELVGLILEELRRSVSILEELLAADFDPSTVLAVLPHGAAADLGGERMLFGAACAVRGAELAEQQARERRVSLVARARDEGAAWVFVEDTDLRSVETHVATGRTLVATADPYAGTEPYGLDEVMLDAATGDVLAGPAGAAASYASRADWEAEWTRRRAEIGARLDSGRPTVSDEK